MGEVKAKDKESLNFKRTDSVIVTMTLVFIIWGVQLGKTNPVNVFREILLLCL